MTIIQQEGRDFAESRRRVKESNLWHKFLRKVGLEKPAEVTTTIFNSTKEPYIEENIMLGNVKERDAEPPESVKDIIKSQFENQ